MGFLTLVKSENLEDWYTIERAVHSHHESIVQTGRNSYSYQWSGRISDACVEGSALEMRSIARAIQDRSTAQFKRCAVRCEGDLAFFWSPRNSSKEGKVPYMEAFALAQEIKQKLELNTIVPTQSLEN